MKQIKTIKNRLDNAESFDQAVNAALAEGWQLTRRDVLQPKAQSENVQTYTMLYAELEQEVITASERCCENCRHFLTDPTEEPCRGCTSDASNWEAAE